MYVSRKLICKRIEIKSDNINLSKGYKIVLLSDLHGREIGEKQKYLADTILAQKADVILLAGDMVDAYDTDANAAINLCKKLLGTAPIVSVRGNHFYKAGSNVQKQMNEAFDKMGIVTLTNSSMTLDAHGVLIQIDGIDDAIKDINSKEKTKKQILKETKKITIDAIEKLNEKVKKSAYRILLCHRPTEGDTFAKKGYDLALCGHTHAGQWKLPFGIEILGNEAEFFPKENKRSGLRHIEGMPIIITSGIGYSNVKIRTFNPPEIVVITIN